MVTQQQTPQQSVRWPPLPTATVQAPELTKAAGAADRRHHTILYKLQGLLVTHRPHTPNEPTLSTHSQSGPTGMCRATSNHSQLSDLQGLLPGSLMYSHHSPASCSKHALENRALFLPQTGPTCTSCIPSSCVSGHAQPPSN